MRVDFYLKSGAVIQIPGIDEVEYTVNSGAVVGYKLTPTKEWKVKPVYIAFQDISAIVRVEE